MSKPKGEKSSRPLRRAMNHETAVHHADEYRSESLFPEKGEAEQTSAGDDKVRILVPITRETHEFLKREAARSATSVSALCSLAITDWADARRRATAEYPVMSKEEGYRKILQGMEVPPEVMAKVKELERMKEQRMQQKQP